MKVATGGATCIGEMQVHTYCLVVAWARKKIRTTQDNSKKVQPALLSVEGMPSLSLLSRKRQDPSPMKTPWSVHVRTVPSMLTILHDGIESS